MVCVFACCCCCSSFIHSLVGRRQKSKERHCCCYCFSLTSRVRQSLRSRSFSRDHKNVSMSTPNVDDGGDNPCRIWRSLVLRVQVDQQQQQQQCRRRVCEKLIIKIKQRNDDCHDVVGVTPPPQPTGVDERQRLHATTRTTEPGEFDSWSTATSNILASKEWMWR